MELPSCQWRTQRPLLDWARLEYAFEQEQVSVLTIDTNQPPASTHCATNTRAPSSPARASAAETLTLERTRSGLVNQAYFTASMRSR